MGGWNRFTGGGWKRLTRDGGTLRRATVVVGPPCVPLWESLSRIDASVRLKPPPMTMSPPASVGRKRKHMAMKTMKVSVPKYRADATFGEATHEHEHALQSADAMQPPARESFVRELVPAQVA